MSRSAEEISASLSLTVKTLDPSADLAKGPLFNYMIAPTAPEIAALEKRNEDLRLLASQQIAQVATDDELSAIGVNYGIPRIGGEAATCLQTFFTSSRPQVDIQIRRGDLVGTADGSKLYVVTTPATLSAASADVAYVASRRRYEVTAPVRATAVGPDFNLPATRIKKMVTVIAGIDGTENRGAADGGLLKQSSEDYVTRIREKFAGLNPETGGGIRSSIREFAPNDVIDIMLVYPKDRTIWKRSVDSPAIDAYVSGTVIGTTTDRIVSTTNQATIVLAKQPVLSVASVTVNGTAVTAFALLKDLDPGLAGSSRAGDMVVLGQPLNQNDVVSVVYSYNSLVNDMQSQVFDANDRQFNTDILVKEPHSMLVTIVMNVLWSNSRLASSGSDVLRNYVLNTIESGIMASSFRPNTFIDRALSQIPGITSLTLSKFTLSEEGTLDVQPIELNKNEVGQVDLSTFAINQL